VAGTIRRLGVTLPSSMSSEGGSVMSSSSASEMDPLLDGFAGYLRRERGVSMFTVDL
jgi:hypothetical protein